MTKDELVELCTFDLSNADEEWFFGPSLYGSGRWIKRYVGMPEDWPLGADCEHGPGIHDFIPETELRSSCSLFLLSSSCRLHKWKSLCPNKSCVVSGAPFVFFRKINDIKPVEGASGTVVFPVHSTRFVTPLVNWSDYINKLRNLPIEFHPITICLYYLDVLSGVADDFFSTEFELVSCGSCYDPHFIDRFYSILHKHEYCTSNAIGSYTYYSVDLGVPFFLYGEFDELVLCNVGDSNYPIGTSTHDSMSKHSQYAKTLFKGTSKHISDDQRKFVRYALGMDVAIDREELRKVLTLGGYIEGLRRQPMRTLLNYRPTSIPGHLSS